jgi:hypothetical protein
MPTNKLMKIVPLCTAFLLLIACLAYARTDHKEYKDYKLSACSDCHTGAGDMSNHGDYREHRLLAQRADTNCMDCHLQSKCNDCHNGGNIEAYMQKSLSREGETMPTTHVADFISTHAIKAKDDPQNCYRCHESSFCSDCHLKQNPGNMHIANHSAAGNNQTYFLNGGSSAADKAAHAADARRNLQSCQGCHPDAIHDCGGCHTELSGGPKVLRQR